MRSLEVVDGIYNLSNKNSRHGLDCNPYLLIDGDEAVLFDPGSNLDFELVLSSIEELIDPSKIKYMVLHHQDPDVCQSVPKYEELGLKFKVVTSWRAMTLIQFYGVKSKFYSLVENNYKLELSSGRVLEFIPTPYLHFPGAFVSYDIRTKSLISSDLFGAFSHKSTAYADDTYMERMLAFHEHYMPSNLVIRPVMETLLKYEIKRILPQHGSMIVSNPKKYIEALRILECGRMLSPVKKNLMASGGFTTVFNELLRRISSLYEYDEVIELFSNIEELSMNSEGDIDNYQGNPVDIWEKIFVIIKEKKGVLWLSVLEPFVRNLSAIYDISVPEIFNNLIKTVNEENKKLLETNLSLEQTIKSVGERLTKCDITGLYNEKFFKSILLDELENEDWRDIGSVAVISIDDHSRYILEYGNREEPVLLNNMAYILKEIFGTISVFRMESSDFAVYIKGTDRVKTLEVLEQVRNEISRSDLFLEKVSVSIGVAFPLDIELDKPTLENTLDGYLDIAYNRLRTAKMKGKNLLVSEGEIEYSKDDIGKVLIVDSDETNLQVLETFLKNIDVEIITATDGYAAYELAELHYPDIIISEINLPKLDGFLLRKKMLENSSTKSIEFVYLSYQKDEASLNRAIELGVFNYIKKPYLVSEIIGLIKRSISQ